MNTKKEFNDNTADYVQAKLELDENDKPRFGFDIHHSDESVTNSTDSKTYDDKLHQELKELSTTCNGEVNSDAL